MARAMWKGAIQFGLVTIPVKLYLATESNRGISFNLLHKTDLTRIQMKTWCPAENEPISRADTVRGYEWAPDQYVVITDEDLESVPLKTVRSIEIEQFVPKDDDRGATRFVEKAYYLEPDAIGRKAFSLLKEILAEKGLTAICKVVIKDREALAALDPFGPTMLLSTLAWPDEVRDVKDLDLPSDLPAFKPAERAMAEQLIAAMTGAFNPAEYHDEYREALMKVIESKVEGKQIFTPQPVEAGSNLVDLMAALEASVEAARKSRHAAGRPVSVKEARARSAARASAARPSDAAAGEAPVRKAAASKAATAAARAATADEAEVARPARRRKSA
jgi:DNA end-binding protein Ku